MTVNSQVSNAVRVGVAVIIIRDGCVLLGERIGAHGAHTWATPGGHLEWGESIEDCAIRETFEETGLTVSGLKKVSFTNDVFSTEDKHYVTLFLQASEVAGEAAVKEPNKCKQWRWFEFDKLPEPLFLPLTNLLNDPDIQFKVP